VADVNPQKQQEDKTFHQTVREQKDHARIPRCGQVLTARATSRAL